MLNNQKSTGRETIYSRIEEETPQIREPKVIEQIQLQEKLVAELVATSSALVERLHMVLRQEATDKHPGEPGYAVTVPLEGALHQSNEKIASTVRLLSSTISRLEI